MYCNAEKPIDQTIYTNFDLYDLCLRNTYESLRTNDGKNAEHII
jgi:hypothetical protein